MSMPKQMC